MKKLFVFSLLAISQCVCAYDGYDLKEYFDSMDRISRNQESNSDYNNHFFLVGYVRGVADSGNTELFCIPSGVKNGQVLEVVRKLLMQSPQIWHMSADELISSALIASFPCKKSKFNPKNAIPID